MNTRSVLVYIVQAYAIESHPQHKSSSLKPSLLLTQLKISKAGQESHFLLSIWYFVFRGVTKKACCYWKR